MFHPTHTYPATDTQSGVLDFHRIDPETLAIALGQLNAIIDCHSALMRQDSAIAQALLRYENLLIDAQSGSADALKRVTSVDEFDKILHLAEKTTHPAYEQLRLEYLDFRTDLMKFRERYLSTSRVD